MEFKVLLWQLNDGHLDDAKGTQINREWINVNIEKKPILLTEFYGLFGVQIINNPTIEISILKYFFKGIKGFKYENAKFDKRPPDPWLELKGK